tara:strand:+ start:484 stop:918 length:435 start_codon:yes stop_codon:yes gene_type:complete
MNSKLSIIALLVALGITDAYLLSHPNLVGKLGIIFYKHNYIKTFPNALVTVFLCLGVTLLIGELALRFIKRSSARLLFVVFLFVSLAWLGMVHQKFSTFSYSLTGKAFIYGAYLLPIIIFGIFSFYFIKCFAVKGTPTEKPSIE